MPIFVKRPGDADFPPLEVATYTTTQAFRRVDVHVCVAVKDSGELIAVTGPVDEQGEDEAKRYAALFAAAPDLLAACEDLVQWEDGAADRECRLSIGEAVRAAIAKARGSDPVAAKRAFDGAKGRGE